MIQKAKDSERKVVGVWIRVSTEDQAQGESPEHHRKRAEMYAESKGWQIVRVYDLSGVSGKSVMNHPEAQAMMKDVASGRITGLIFSKLARLARNTRELLDFAEYFEKYRADLISLAESIDTSTPAGRFFYTLIAALAQWEREEISSRAKASVVVRAKMGKILGGAPPFGFRRESGQFILDPVEAPIRRHLFELFLEHRRLKTVAAVANKTGYRMRSGRKFSDTTVRRLLEDPIAKGLRRANYTRQSADGKKWELKSQDEWIYQQVEPIVSEETWTTVNAILGSWKEGEKKPRKRAVHLFTGLARCGNCDAGMTVKHLSPSYDCPKCHRKIRIADLEAVFRERLHDFFQSADEVRDYLEAEDHALREKRELLAALQAEEAQVRSDTDKTYKLYLDGVISSQGFGERYGPLEARLKALGDEIPRLQGEADFLAIQHLSSEEIVSQAQDVYGGWENLTPEEKRSIVEGIVEKILIYEDTVAIDLYHSPDYPLNHGRKATNPHGFIAAMRENRAGNPTDSAARAITTRPSSSGCRSDSSTPRGNSSSSSRKRTP